MNFDTSRSARGLLARTWFRNFALCLVLAQLGAWLTTHHLTRVHADPNNRSWLGPARTLNANFTGDPAITRALRPGSATALSIAAGDFDQDGYNDLVAGYATSEGARLAIYKGNVDAFVPQSQATFDAMARGQYPDPFLPNAMVLEAPANPDFLEAGRFNGAGSEDLLIASRGGNSLFVMSGDGTGDFQTSQTISVPGAVTGVQSFTEGLYSMLLVGVHTPSGSMLLEYSGSAAGLVPLRTVSIPDDPAGFDFGRLDGDDLVDWVVVAGGRLYLLRGNAAAVEEIPANFNVTSAVLGRFTFDRTGRPQIMALGSDAATHLLAYSGFDPTPFSAEELQAKIKAAHAYPRPQGVAAPAADPGAMVWTEIETTPGAAAGASNPLLIHTRVSGAAADDAVILSSGQIGLVSHPNSSAVVRAANNQASVVSSPVAVSQPVVALAARVNADWRQGIIYLSPAQMGPGIISPDVSTPHTFTVNNTSDTVDANPGDGICADSSGNCTLRAAIMETNALAGPGVGTNTIMIPAGTYALTRPRATGDYSGDTGGLYVLSNVTITGAGSGTTIIDGGQVDRVFAVNEDISPTSNASAAISGVTIQNGKNRGTLSDGESDNDGGGLEFDTGSSGTATLSLTQTIVQNNQTTDGNGGGIILFNYLVPTPSTAVTISNCTISNNTSNGVASDSFDGGGMEATVGNNGSTVYYASFTMTNSTVSGNHATGTGFKGGGISIYGPAIGNISNIHESTISGNQASGEGGGGIFTFGAFNADQGTSIIGNSTTTTATGGGNGGGIEVDGTYITGTGVVTSNCIPSSSAGCITLSEVNLADNTAAGNGGGIDAEGENGPITIQYSRITGNTASGTGANINNKDDTTGGTQGILATENWWGTNNPSSTLNPSVSACSGTSDWICYLPNVVLSLSSGSQQVKINAATGLTANIGKDSSNTQLTATELSVISQTAVTYGATLGSISNQSPASGFTSSGQSTATYTAGATPGAGSASATVDSQTVSVTINVLQPPSMTKSFNPTTVTPNSPSTVTFSLTNSNTTAIDTSFSDTLPANLLVATTPSVVNNCGGTVTAAAGSGSITFSNASTAAGSCTIKVNVQSAVDNTYNNSVTLDSTAAGNATSASTASLTVIAPPGVTKSFSPIQIPLNGTSTLSFAISSSNVNLSLSGVNFTDTLPAGLVVGNSNGLTNSCGGTATAVAGSGMVSLSGVTLAPGASCAVTVSTTGTTGGVKNNSVQINSTQIAGNTSSAGLTVVAAAAISKSFLPASIPAGSMSALGFTIQNPNAISLTGVAFTDTLPAGLTIATPNGLTGSCGTGTITATAGTGAITLSGGTISANSSCSFSVNVASNTAGTYTNTTSNVNSNEGGSGNTATAMLTVVAPPTVGKTFNPTSISVNGTSTLTITLGNPAGNTVAENGVAFTDLFPSNMQVAATPMAANACGGTFAPAAGATSISLSGGTIATNSTCSVSVNVTVSASATYVNTTGNVSSTNGGSGSTGSATLVVASPPTITKAFSQSAAPVNTSVSMTFTLSNPNSGQSLSGISFSDTFPAGLTVGNAANVVNNCGGTFTAVTGGTSVSLASGTLGTGTSNSIAARLPLRPNPRRPLNTTILRPMTTPAGSSCTITVPVVGTTTGVKSNTTGPISATESGSGAASNTAIIEIIAPPGISKAFGASSIPANSTTSLTFNFSNPNINTPFTNVSVNDTLPAGLQVANPNGVSGSCTGDGANVIASPGASTIGVSAIGLAAGASCSLLVNVTGTTAGVMNNTTGNVSATYLGSNTIAGSGASASLVVLSPPSIAKAFGAQTIAVNGSTSLTFTITNPNAATALTGVAFTDPLPAGMTAVNGTSTVCGGALTISGGNTITLSGATIAGGSQCQFPVTVTVTTASVFNNTTSNVTSTNGGTGNQAMASIASGGSLGGSFGAKSGPVNARAWIINIGNGNSFTATGAQVTGLTLTQSFGAACTPVILGIPAVAGDIPPGGTLPATVTIDFSSCSGRVFFKAVASVSSNGGTVHGTITALNQQP